MKPSSPISPTSPTSVTSPSRSINARKRRRSKIFQLFGSPKSEPPPSPTTFSIKSSQSVPPIDIDFKIINHDHDEDDVHDLKDDGEEKHNKSGSQKKRRLRRHRRRGSLSSISQFDKLKARISGLFPKKTVRDKSDKSNKSKSKQQSKSKSKTKARTKRSNSFSFRRSRKHRKREKDKDKNKNNKTKQNKKKNRKWRKRKHKKSQTLTTFNTDWINEINEEKETDHHQQQQHINEDIHDIDDINEIDPRLRDSSPRKMANAVLHLQKKAILQGIIEEEEDIDHELHISDISETEEYKDDHHGVSLHKLQLAPRSSSIVMRSYEKRPEYVTYYPPSSLIDVFNNITINGEETSVSTELTKIGTKNELLHSVDHLFESAPVTPDYGNFYGYSPENTNPNNHQMKLDFKLTLTPDFDNDYELNEGAMDHSALSSLPDDEEYDENDINYDPLNLSWQ